MTNKDAFDLWWEWADKPLDNKQTIDAAIYDAVMALPPDERRDRAKVNEAVRDGLPWPVAAGGECGPVRRAEGDGIAGSSLGAPEVGEGSMMRAPHQCSLVLFPSMMTSLMSGSSPPLHLHGIPALHWQPNFSSQARSGWFSQTQPSQNKADSFYP
jgi:hypothetical protein